MGGDALVTMALAGSLFFSISPHAARGRVALYLLLTMAPFAVVAPLLGPVLDASRRGRRLVVTAAAAGRAAACLSMAGNLHGVLLFPEAFVVLVLSKAHTVTKSALVPSTVDSPDQLVEANSRLAVLAVVAGFAAALPGVLVLKIDGLGAPWVMRLAAVVFAAGAVAALRLQRSPEAPPASLSRRELPELGSASIRLSAGAMAVLRAAVGFLTFLVAFSFRRDHDPAWWFGVVLAASLSGTFVGAVIAPRLRRAVDEERIVMGSLVMVAGVALVAAWTGGLVAVAALAASLGVAAGAAKLAFDSIVQRDAPEAARGRAFARFETRFQLAWVLAAAVPVVLPIPNRTGMGLIALAAAFGAFSYAGGRRVTQTAPTAPV